MSAIMKRLAAIVMALALMIPAVAVSEEDPLKASINKTEFTAGEEVVITWEADPSWGNLIQSTLSISYEGNDYEDIFDGALDGVPTKDMTMNLSIQDEFDNGATSGVCTTKLPEFVSGDGLARVSYINTSNYDVCRKQFIINVSSSAPAPDYFDFKFSKPISEWEKGDEIEITWSANKDLGLSGSYFSIVDRETNDNIYGYEEGTYKFTIAGEKGTQLNFAAGSEEYDCSFTYVFRTKPTAEPTVAPTTAPTVAPTTAPTSAPTNVPTNAPTTAPTTAPGKSVELNLDAITIGAKQTVDTVKVVEGSDITWTSSNEKVATVDADGKIKGVKKGTATITATDDQGNSDSVEVTVVAKNKGVKKIKLNKKNVTLKHGEKLALKATLTPSDAKNKKIIWTSSNTAVATVNAKGKVMAVGVGEATITATASSGKIAECKITVTGAKVKKITIEGNKKMKVGEIQTLIAKIAPEFAENKDVKWKSSSKKIATVDENGVVTALKKGTVTITATAKDGSKVKASFTIKIKK